MCIMSLWAMEVRCSVGGTRPVIHMTFIMGGQCLGVELDLWCVQTLYWYTSPHCCSKCSYPEMLTHKALLLYQCSGLCSTCIVDKEFVKWLERKPSSIALAGMLHRGQLSSLLHWELTSIGLSWGNQEAATEVSKSSAAVCIYIVKKPVTVP